MTIPPRFLDEVRNRLALSQVIGKKIKLTRAGREFKGCCPFHREKTASFYVNDDKQFYHCFGCGAHGDAFGFLMQHDNLSFMDAVEALAAEAGLQVPKADPESIKRAEQSRDLHALMDVAARWFEDQLHAPANRKILDYLTGRGLKEETIAAFRLGYAPSDGQALRKFLLGNKFTDAQMIEVGLLKKSERGGEPYIFFRDRAMFPVMDRRGRVIAFGGRILPENLRPPSTGDFTPPKYINSTETPLFDKGRTLYADNKARLAAREGLPVILMEGYMDVIASWQAGFRGAVAPMGTAMTEDQAMLLWSMIVSDEKIPILCFDGDNAGRKAAARACERLLPLLKPNHSARIAFLPEGEDPDSLIKANGPAAFQAALDSAISLFDFLWLSVTTGKDFAKPETRAGVVKALNDEISRIADREVQVHYQALAREKVSETFFRRQDRKGSQAPQKIAPLRPRAPAFRDIHAKGLLAAVINHPYIFEEIEESLATLQFHDPRLDSLKNRLAAALSQGPGLDAEGLRAHLINTGFEKETGDILAESVYVHAGFARPRADSALVAARWMEVWRDAQGKTGDIEITEGWKAAFLSGNIEEEEKLKNLLRMKGIEGGGA